MSQPKPSERRPTKEEFAKELEVAIRAAGYDSELTRDAAKGLVSIRDGSALSVDHLYADLAGADAKRRVEGLAKAARFLVHPPRLPATWEEAKGAIVPTVKTRISVVVEELRRGDNPVPMHVAAITPHLVFALGYPAEAGMLSVPAETLKGWGVSPEEAFPVAAANLQARTSGAWRIGNDAPGVYVSPWHDGLDGSRMLFPGVFRSLPLKGSPVALLPTPSMMLVAGSEDEGGLFHLGLLARRVFEKNRMLFALRTARLAADGVSWEDWSPPATSAAYEPLRLLRAIEEVHDYEEHAKAVAEVAKKKGQEVLTLPRLELLQSAMGAQVLTVTTWRAGKPAALPKADAILLKRGDEVLGVARWDDAIRALGPSALAPIAGYPVRHLALDFPEDWQLGGLALQPWEPQGPR